MKHNTRTIVLSALLAALTCIATMVIRIPSPFKGYLNLGDSVVLLSGWLLPPVYGALAAGIGSALADLFSGYVTYAPATFLIKALMALAAHFLSKHIRSGAGRLLSGLAAILILTGGYLLFEGILYGFAPSLVNVLPNALQGAAGLVLGLAMVRIAKHINFMP